MSISVAEAALKLVETYRLLNLPGVFVGLDKLKLTALQKKYDLPDALVEWYSVALPRDVEIPTSVLDIVLGDGEQLDQALIGYRFEGITGIELEDWNKNWLVIGGEGEYPLIIHTASANDEAVYLGSADPDAWHIKMLSKNLSGFLLGLNEYINLYIVKYKRVIENDDEKLKPEFIRDFEAALDKNSNTEGLGRVWLEEVFGLWVE